MIVRLRLICIIICISRHRVIIIRRRLIIVCYSPALYSYDYDS